MIPGIFSKVFFFFAVVAACACVRLCVPFFIVTVAFPWTNDHKVHMCIISYLVQYAICLLFWVCLLLFGPTG